MARPLEASCEQAKLADTFQQTRRGPSVCAVIPNPFQEFTNVIPLPRDSGVQGAIYKTRIHYKRLIPKTSILALESSDPQISGSGKPFLGDINSACLLTSRLSIFCGLELGIEHQTKKSFV